MSSLTKRPSGHLVELVLQYSKSLMFELESTGTSRRTILGLPVLDPSDDAGNKAASVYPPAVVVWDLDEIGSGEVAPGEVPRRLESRYTTPADADLMVFVPILANLLLFWVLGAWVVPLGFIIMDLIASFILGLCTLTLFRRTGIHPVELDLGDGCAVLMDDNMTVVIQGSQRIVEAITKGDFYFSPTGPQTQPPSEDSPITVGWEETQSVLCAALEGGYTGGSAVLLGFLTSSILPRAISLADFGNTLFVVCFWACRRAVGRSSPSTMVTIMLRLVGWSIGSSVPLMVIISDSPRLSPSPILLAIFFSVQLLWSCLFVVLRSRSYHIRMGQFLCALGRPTERKSPFSTQASAATFACLVLCQDLPRPVKNINVLGVLDILIPNQRDIWRVWKARVADRIAHEERIDFAPTIPTFPDLRQERLKRLLDEAQSGYNTYISLPPKKQSTRE